MDRAENQSILFPHKNKDFPLFFLIEKRDFLFKRKILGFVRCRYVGNCFFLFGSVLRCCFEDLEVFFVDVFDGLLLESPES